MLALNCISWSSITTIEWLKTKLVAQAHELRCMIKELDMLKIVMPDKFVVGGIIAKLLTSWRDFATTLKHKRTEITVSDLISSLGIEEKTRAKDGRFKVVEGQTSANMEHQPHHNDNGGKGKSKNNKPMQTTTFKKKKNKENEDCFVCSSTDHRAKKCRHRKGRKRPQQKTVSTVTNDGEQKPWV